MKKATDLTIVLDRSGSMITFGDEVIGSINAFFDKQREEPGECKVTLVQFDTIDRYEKVLDNVDLNEANLDTFEPRAGTPLLDCLGSAINETGQRLSALPENQRPENVVFLIMTDGQENSSREFTAAQISEMIQRQENVYNWTFVYLGAKQDAINEAGKLGVRVSVSADFTSIEKAFNNFSGKFANARSSLSAGESLQNVKSQYEYSEQDRNDIK